MFLEKLDTKQIVEESKFYGAATLLGLQDTEDLRDTDPESPTYGNLIIPPEVESYELSQAAIEQYRQYVEGQGVDVNDLIYDPETGLFEEPTELDLQKVQDRKTEEWIRRQCVPLLEKSDGKMIDDHDEADIVQWRAWRQSIRAIVKNPLSYVGQEIPAAPFPVTWDPKGTVLNRI